MLFNRGNKSKESSLRLADAVNSIPPVTPQEPINDLGFIKAFPTHASYHSGMFIGTANCVTATFMKLLQLVSLCALHLGN